MCMGVPALSLQGSLCSAGAFGVPCAAPSPLCLALCILCLLPALPARPWDSGDPPGPPGWVPLPWGTAWAWQGCAEPPHRCQHCMGGCWAGAARGPSEPPRLPGGPTECWGPVGEPLAPLVFPLGKSQSCWGELRSDPQNSGHILLPSRAAPIPGCPSSFGCVPVPLILRGSPALGGPQPVGFPVPRVSPALGGRWAQAGPSNADFVSLSPL